MGDRTTVDGSRRCRQGQADAAGLRRAHRKRGLDGAEAGRQTVMMRRLTIQLRRKRHPLAHVRLFLA